MGMFEESVSVGHILQMSFPKKLPILTDSDQSAHP